MQQLAGGIREECQHVGQPSRKGTTQGGERGKAPAKPGDGSTAPRRGERGREGPWLAELERKANPEKTALGVWLLLFRKTFTRFEHGNCDITRVLMELC